MGLDAGFCDGGGHAGVEHRLRAGQTAAGTFVGAAKPLAGANRRRPTLADRCGHVRHRLGSGRALPGTGTG